MESLRAIGLAADICQFLESGYKVLDQAKVTGRRSVSDVDLECGISQLQRRSVTLIASTSDLASPELELSTLVEECAAAAEELISKLNAPKPKKSKSAWSALRSAKPGREKYDLEEVEEQFRNCKCQLQAQFVNTLRHGASEELDRIITTGHTMPGELATLQSAAKSIHLAIGCSRAATGVVQLLRALILRFEEAIVKAQQAAILNTLKFQGIHERFASITKAEARTFSWLLDTRDNENGHDPDNDTAIQLDDTLIQARQQFIKWLEDGEGYFYLSGKPGAGKSTLMKFICLHENFYRSAKTWCHGSTLLVGRFFFWKPGQSEQKSISGLLRGLLYSILETSPAIVAIAFPELCDSFNKGSLGSAVVEHKDVQRALENILISSAKSGDYKVILAIDGLDEFEGEHAELLEMMQSWVSKYKSTIKICVSSREYGVFEEFFAECPRFRLHELTHTDMSHLITSRLKNNKFFSSLPTEEAGPIKVLISERAEGVFLWVVMVVAAIDDGLISGAITNATELDRYIQQCPNELDDLLHHLLITVTIHSRVWAFKAISLVKFTQFKVPELLQSSQNCPGVGLLDLMVLDESAPSWNMSAFQPRSESKSSDLSARLEIARKKVLGRCKGFLSIVTISEADVWPANRDERMYAAITHRSIVEFLCSDTAIGHMAQYVSGFDPYFALFSTMVACLRFLEPSNYPLLKPKESLPKRENMGLADVLDDSLQRRWKDLIRCGFLLAQSGSPRFFSLLDSVGDAIKRHLTIQLSMLGIRLPVAEASPHQLLITLTLSNRVYEYSEWRRRQDVQNAKAPPMSLSTSRAFRDMMRYFQLDDYEFPAVDQVGGWTQTNKPLDWIKWDLPNQKEPSMTIERFSSHLTEFFERGIGLNWTPPGTCGHWDGSLTIDHTPWTCWQTFLWAMLVCEIPFVDKYADFLDRFLQHGADHDIVLFSFAPLKSLHIKRLIPQDGWILLVPYTKDKALLGTFMENGLANNDESRQKYDRMPAALIRDSAPLYLAAKEKSWVFTLRDLVALWFPNDVDHFTRLFDSYSHITSGGQQSISPYHIIEAGTGVLGSPRGSCDLGIYLEETRVQAGITDISATMSRVVKVM